MKTFIIILALSFTSFCSAQFVSGDDKLHLGAGFLISGSTYTAVYMKTKNKKKAFWYSLGMSAIAGVTKGFFLIFCFHINGSISTTRN